MFCVVCANWVTHNAMCTNETTSDNETAFLANFKEFSYSYSKILIITVWREWRNNFLFLFFFCLIFYSNTNHRHCPMCATPDTAAYSGTASGIGIHKSVKCDHHFYYYYYSNVRRWTWYWPPPSTAYTQYTQYAWCLVSTIQIDGTVCRRVSFISKFCKF